MVLTEEEQLMFRDENVYPHATVLINNTNRLNERTLRESEEELRNLKEDLDEELNLQVQRLNKKEEEIEAHKKENIKLLETIRDQKEDLLRAREKGNQFKDTLAVKSNELGETREQLKALQDQFE
ncbi:hypothetical protein MAR_002582 [Mya arenaria]|uniref:Uncharacterized protein n=1 Tax=Mya arenaria TaxID=6604 RepID=A0ABY7G6N5_MYAAR|nr:hypothetical protein MAR_002582 [Mya arenaria]